MIYCEFARAVEINNVFVNFVLSAVFDRIVDHAVEYCFVSRAMNI